MSVQITNKTTVSFHLHFNITKDIAGRFCMESTSYQWIPLQNAKYTESVTMPWRHHAKQDINDDTNVTMKLDSMTSFENIEVVP